MLGVTLIVKIKLKTKKKGKKLMGNVRVRYVSLPIKKVFVDKEASLFTLKFKTNYR